MAKVDLVSSQLKKTTVKFVYCIRVVNEGQVAGYATEIKDYVPSGLKFVADDNPDWTLQKDGTATTDKLKDTLLEPGQSAVVEITLTWINDKNNLNFQGAFLLKKLIKPLRDLVKGFLSRRDGI